MNENSDSLPKKNSSEEIKNNDISNSSSKENGSEEQKGVEFNSNEIPVSSPTFLAGLTRI